jgi:hypothetical protein
MKLFVKLLWKISVWAHTIFSDLCEWCSDYYFEHYWYEEVQKETGKFLWRVWMP